MHVSRAAAGSSSLPASRAASASNPANRPNTAGQSASARSRVASGALIRACAKRDATTGEGGRTREKTRGRGGEVRSRQVSTKPLNQKARCTWHGCPTRSSMRHPSSPHGPDGLVHLSTCPRFHSTSRYHAFSPNKAITST